MSRLTTTEARLVEQYVSVLDYVSRCAQAIDTDDWFYLYDKSAKLAMRAERLAELAADLWRTIDRSRGGYSTKLHLRVERRGAIAAAVAWHRRHYRAGRLLHPHQQQRGRR